MNWSQRAIHAGILLSFALVPVWYRLPEVPPLLPPLYVSRFALLLPMLWTIACWLLSGLPGWRALRQDRVRRCWALSLLLLVVWGFASQWWAFQRGPHPDVGATAALQFGIAALFALVVACVPPPRPLLIAVLIVSLLWNSLLGGAQVALQHAVGLQSLGEFPISVDWQGVSVVEADGLRWLRPYGLLPHPNPFAGVLTLGLLACSVWILSRRRWQWIAGTLSGLLGLWVLGLSFSRAAWLGTAAGAAAILVLAWRGHLRLSRRRLVISALAFLGCGLLFLTLYRPFLLARSGVGAESIEQRSVSDRLVYLDFAMRAIRENPVLGVGAGNFPWKASYYLMFTDFDLLGDNVHNIYLSAWAELGIVGLALYLAALASGIWAALRLLWRQPEPARLAFFGGVIALLLIGLADHYPYTLLQFQAALWGLLAASGSVDQFSGVAVVKNRGSVSSGRSPQSPAASTTSERTHKS